jgi:aldehyde:ferredoxin oxidoreductase
MEEKNLLFRFKGLEMAGYDPRGSWGQGVAYAVANRGACHLSATIFPLEVFFGFLNLSLLLPKFNSCDS